MNATLKRLLIFCSLFGVVALFFACLPHDVFAQGPPGFPNPSPEQTPIDGWLGMLAALGGTYAIKKLRDRD